MILNRYVFIFPAKYIDELNTPAFNTICMQLGKVPCFSGNSFEFHPPEMSSQYFLIVDIRMVTIESSPAGEANVNPSNKKAPAFRTEKRMTKPPAVISVESAARCA